MERDKETILKLLTNDNNLLLWFHRWIDAKRLRCCHCGRDKIQSPMMRLLICKRQFAW